MDKIHDVQSVHLDDQFLYLTVDGHSYRVRLDACSPRLVKATRYEREHFEVSPSGYGLHWSLIDEDLAIEPLLQNAEPLESSVA